MRISIFLSYPTPCFSRQQEFITRIGDYLKSQGLEPRTLGVTDYDMDAPLKAIRRLMLESNGLITVAFRRTFIERGTTRYRTDIEPLKEASVDGKWMTTPWPHVEAAMAYQLGLPILIYREKGVVDDGILERGVVGLYMSEFDLDNQRDDYFTSPEWCGIIGKWEGYVRAVVEKKGNPPQLY